MLDHKWFYRHRHYCHHRHRHHHIHHHCIMTESLLSNHWLRTCSVVALEVAVSNWKKKSIYFWRKPEIHREKARITPRKSQKYTEEKPIIVGETIQREHDKILGVLKHSQTLIKGLKSVIFRHLLETPHTSGCRLSHSNGAPLLEAWVDQFMLLLTLVVFLTN